MHSFRDGFVSFLHSFTIRIYSLLHLLWASPQCSCLWRAPLAPTLSLHSLFPLQQPEGACELLSQVTFFLLSEPSMAPTSLGVKNKVFPMGKGPQGAHKAQQDPPHPPSSLPPCSPSLTVLQPQGASSLFLQHPEHASFTSSLCTGSSLCLECPSTSFTSYLNAIVSRGLP